jgi:ribosomal protein S18 acetylase RimI-like enzyme
MSSKSQLFDRITNIKFIRIGDDHKNTYRLFELKLSSKTTINFDYHSRWVFFEETLRNLFEMPDARFRHLIVDCMQNHGIAYAFVPLNATSVTSNISAMTILTRKINSIDNIYVCYMATKKEHRRQGLGTRLLQQIVHRSLSEQQNGIKYITMHVNTLNTVALELYERCGWRCYEYLSSYLAPEPHHPTNHAFALRLNLDNVKNVTSLCRDPNAIDIKLSEDEQSIQNCHRKPVQF